MICGNDFSGPSVVAALREIGQARHERVVADAKERTALRLMHRHRLEHDEPGAAFGETRVSCTDIVVHEPVFTREARDHRGEDDAIRKHDAPNFERREELAHFPRMEDAMTSFSTSVAPS